MATCAACGQENPSGFRFCGACGAALAEQAEVVQEERKVVTVLFADLVGFTSRAEQLDPEDVQALLSPYHARLRTELERFGGTVEKFIGDAVMALFGAPTAHEDDAERAVRAGLAIRDAVAELDAADPGLQLQVRVGIATGEALVRLGARPHEGEGMAAGDVVNTAARLQAAAAVNGVLVGEGTYRATARAIDYRVAEPIEAKGKTEPVPVWEALEARARYGVDVIQRDRAPLVGRQEELDLLVGALGRVRRERAPQLVTLVGVPGIGKSRLVWELFAAVEADPELVYWRQGRCLPYGDGVAFWALGEMVKAQAGVLETDAGGETKRKLHRSVQDLAGDPGEAQWLEVHLRPLLGLGGEAELGGDRRLEVFTAWRRFFEALAEQRPLVLVFEDLHWADDGLLDFVDHLVDWAGDVPILVVGTARPELLERRPEWGGGKRNATTVSLSPLSEPETARLLSSLLARAVLPAELQTLLLARAGGNPLYAEEFARMLSDRGVGASDDVPLPESVQGVIAARLDLLGADEKVLLQNAAVVGKVFWSGALSAVEDLPRWTVEERLHGLERKEFVRRERRSQVSAETEYAFRHVLVRDVAYGQIPRGRRADKHRAVAEWIAQLAPDRAEDHAEMLAHHYLSALEFARAAGSPTETLAQPARHALRDAGDRALSLNAFPSARRFYQAALELWPEDDPERGHLLLRYGKACYQIGPANLEVLPEARDLLLAAAENEAAAEAEAMLGLLLWHRGESDRAREQFDRALALVADSGPSPSKGYVLASVSRSLLVGGQSEETIQVARQALEIADELGLDDIRASALNSIGYARAQSGDSAGKVDLEQSIQIALGANSPESIRGYVNLADLMERSGDLKRAFELRREGARVADRFGDVFRIDWFRGEHVNEGYWCGRWDEALQGATDFLAKVEAGSPHYLESVCREARGRINAARGDLRAALADSDKNVQATREWQDTQIALPALSSRARFLVEAGRIEEAGSLATEVLASSEEMSASWPIDLAVVLRALGRGEELAEWAGRVKVGTPWLSGAVAFATGDFLAAAETYAEIGSLPDEALARLFAAEQLIAENRRSDGDAELQRALAFFRSVGAKAYVARGEALLAASA